MTHSTHFALKLTPVLFSLATLARAADCSAQEATPAQSPLPVRDERSWSVLAEVGTSSSDAAALRLAYHIAPHFSVEGAGGISREGYTANARARYNLSVSNLTSYIGLGATRVFGTNDSNASPSGSGEDVRLHIEPANYLQLSSGVDWIARNGLSFMTTVGYSLRLGPNNVEVLNDGKLTSAQQQAVGTYGDALFIALGLGYSF